MSCCKDKKYYTELCDKCKKDMTTFDADNLDSYGGYKQYKDTFGEDDGSDWFGSAISIKCECGSEAVSAPGHSSWCPKFGK